MLIATRFYLGCSISAYHYDIVCNLVFMSVVTHLCSINFITPYLHHRAILLGVARVLLIGLTYLFAVFMFAERNNPWFPTGMPGYAPTNSTQVPKLIAPAACFVSGNNNITNWVSKDIEITLSAIGDVESSGAIEYDVLVIFTLVSFGVAALNSRVTREKHPTMARLLRWARVPLLIAAWAISAAAFFKFWQLRTWMQNSIWPADKAENDWTFGQFLPLLLMMLAGLAFIEAFSGKSCTISVETFLTFIFALDHLEDALFNILRRFWNLLRSTVIGKACCRFFSRVWNLLLSLGLTIIGKRWRKWLRKEPFIASCSESQQFLPLKGGVSSWRELEDEKGPVSSWKEIEDESV